MIIRNKNGELIKLNRYDFPNDSIYYEKIMNIKKEFTKDVENDDLKNRNIFATKSMKKPSSSSLMTICNFVNIEI